MSREIIKNLNEVSEAVRVCNEYREMARDSKARGLRYFANLYFRRARAANRVAVRLAAKVA